MRGRRIKTSHDESSVVELEIRPRLPFSLPRTAARLAAFPEAVDLFDGECYRRLLLAGRGRAFPFLLEARQRGAPSRARLDVRLVGKGASHSEARPLAERALRRVLGIHLDVRPFYRRFRDDPLLAPWIRDFTGLRVAGRLTLWETMVQMVLSQQVNLRFAHSILVEMTRALGPRARLDGHVYYDFPSPARFARLDERALRGFRLSGAKAGTLARLAGAFRSGDLDEERLAGLPDEEVRERLCAIKGVGRWTAEFTLLRGLQRLDVFPAGDLGVVKYLAQEILSYDGKASEAHMRELAEAWRPYRGLALIYAYAELARRRRERNSA